MQLINLPIPSTVFDFEVCSYPNVGAPLLTACFYEKFEGCRNRVGLELQVSRSRHEVNIWSKRRQLDLRLGTDGR